MNGLTVYSRLPFVVTFPEVGTIDKDSFRPKAGIIPETPYEYNVAMADLDGDGKTDIATANKDKKTISVFKNTSTIGGGSFAQKVDFTADYAGRIAIGDLDGDGKPDLTVTNYPSATVSVFRNTTTQGVIDARSFAPNVNFAIVHSGSGLAIGDLDGDGKPDLAVTNSDPSTSVSVLRNTSTPGAITFALKVDFNTNGYPRSIALGDLDGDGKPELIIGTNQEISVFKNTSTPGTISASSFGSRVDFAPNTDDERIDCHWRP